VSGTGVIGDYLTALSGQLPGPVVEELADGLWQTRQRYLGQGMDADAAAGAAVAEFGAPDLILAAFTRLSPARRTARRLLACGPVIGGCWAAALIAGRAWTWPVPVVARVLFGVALIGVIGLLATAAFGRRYRRVGRAGAAGCVGIAALDTAMLITVALGVAVVIWPLILAGAASAARLTFTARALRPLLTR
jgi:hypothetical protein